MMYRLYLVLAVAMTGFYSWGQYKGYSVFGSDERVQERSAVHGGGRAYHK
ncbi:hypothetical protein [Chitinimonas lacunae]|uniref:Uncharacterized protein n=1 Tax=Chitinimonas lacunae TaxID=1963018 RepID=A0ABV8MSA5_9NEIS